MNTFVDLESAIKADDLELAVNILKNNPQLITARNDMQENVLHLICKLDSSKCGISGILSYIKSLRVDHEEEIKSLSLQRNYQGRTPLHLSTLNANANLFDEYVNYLGGEDYSVASTASSISGALPIDYCTIKPELRPIDAKHKFNRFSAILNKKVLKDLQEPIDFEEVIKDIPIENSELIENLRFGVIAANYARRIIQKSTTHTCVNGFSMQEQDDNFEQVSSFLDPEPEYESSDEDGYSSEETGDSDEDAAAKDIPDTRFSLVQDPIDTDFINQLLKNDQDPSDDSRIYTILDEEEVDKRFRYLKKMFNYLRNKKAGNCTAHSSLVTYGLLCLGVKNALYMIYIIPKLFADHVLVLSGCDANFNINDPDTYGKKAVCIDAFEGAVYPASELKNRLKTFRQCKIYPTFLHRGRTLDMNVVIPFIPGFHGIQIHPNQYAFTNQQVTRISELKLDELDEQALIELGKTEEIIKKRVAESNAKASHKKRKLDNVSSSSHSSAFKFNDQIPETLRESSEPKSDHQGFGIS